ncbi:type I methionyl aminopeptidase [Dehalococcoidia bacterium]|nr:type I methionyl aminopeptidase [Dehalococcoidia bacterium]MCL0063663.1 type I methionyl aminopeptidase [Dehalococcoidia bacterium]MCL0103075.1 type I methionyl aminopeptidase [Dehalococcoidia bacterium]
MGIIIKSPNEINIMRQAGRIVAAILAALNKEIRPGISTGTLDAIAKRMFQEYGARASFKGYRGFPASICTSVNEEVVHGRPGGRVLQEGDVVAIDVGAIYNGFQGDAAITVGVGKVSPEAKRLIDTARRSLEAGIAAAREGAHLSDISAAIQFHAESAGFSPVRQYAGHGIGREMHEKPQIPNFGPPGKGPVLKRGMTLALEPMINAGGWATKVLPDGWTVVTADGSLSAHFEHTIAVTNGVAEILTVDE